MTAIISGTNLIARNPAPLGARTITLADATSNQVVMSLFNGRGDLLSTRDPLAAFTSWQYDAVGNATLRMDARNRGTTCSFDALNRTVSRLYYDGTRVTNTFDAAGRQLTMSIRIRTGQDVSGVTSWTYDQRGLATRIINGAGRALTYTRDGVGNTTVLMNPDGALMQYSYDLQNRCLTVQNPNAEVTTLVWDALDRMQRITQSNGMVTSHTWDAAGRETLLANRTSAGVARSVYSATYDAAGRLGSPRRGVWQEYGAFRRSYSLYLLALGGRVTRDRQRRMARRSASVYNWRNER